MHKACQQIEKAMPNIDLIIEVIDARIPYSSENPMIQTLRGDKPFLKVLNKVDLADPDMTERWIAHFNAQLNMRAIAISASDSKQAQRVLDECRRLVPITEDAFKQLKTMIMGIPNVGKST